MTDAQPTAEKSATPRTDAAETVRENGGDITDVFTVMRQLERELTDVKAIGSEYVKTMQAEITDLRASLRREENARKVLADENDRLRAAAVHNARHDVTGWICSVCHGWNKVTDQHCVHIHSGAIRSQQS